MIEHCRPYYAEINIDNFRHNFREVKRIAAGRKVIGVIKADAYGHGAVELAKVLNEEKADYFAVAVIAEALELRSNGFSNPILILGYTPECFAAELVRYDITQTVFNLKLAKAISDEAVRQNKTAKVHIKLDTGMGRIGFLQSEEALEEIREISCLPNLEVEGIFTHFSSSDEINKDFTRLQIKRFKKTIDDLKALGIEFKIKHAANSAAIIDLEESYLDAVRPGIMLYGYYPSNEVNRSKVDLRPVMTLKANIVHIKEVEENTPISYGRKFWTKKNSRIATLPFGYADGFTRLLFEKASIIVNGLKAPVVGRICMDQCMIDITECGNVSVGDEVIVMGRYNEINLDADYYAGLLGTINYEILCAVSKRVPRVYVEKGQILTVKNYV